MLRMSSQQFRARCAQFRLLAYCTVFFVIAAMAVSIAAPVLRGAVAPSDPVALVGLVGQMPALFYLGAMLGIGQALGRLAQGRPIQPTLANALRRVGLALSGGGIVSVFMVTNLVRWISGGRGGYLNFDVAGMTLALTGIALILLGHVVTAAVRLQAEMDDSL